MVGEDKIPKIFRLSSYDYDLPEELIAQFPAEPRDSATLLYVPKEGEPKKLVFRELTKLLRNDDVLILNDVAVLPARLYGKKTTGGKVEFLLLENIDDYVWKVLVRPGRRIRVGTRVSFEQGLEATVIKRNEDGSRVVRFSLAGKDFFEILERIGHTPLPPYIKREDTRYDRERYQTIYARKPGAVAAPTAGLHFTDELMDKIVRMGVRIGFVTLNVGWGTFEPIKTEDIREHKMHREYYEIPPETAQLINEAKKSGRRVVAVGTTTTRALESAALRSFPIEPHASWTDLYIFPGFEFKVVDALITNFHLPRSSLLVMVCAFAGYERTMKAYEFALGEKIRFFSYGDAMFVEKMC